MEYNNPSEIVKSLSFGSEGKDKVMAGVEKLAKAVSSTLGASFISVAPMFSTGSLKTTDSATVTPSFVKTCFPNASSYITH